MSRFVRTHRSELRLLTGILGLFGLLATAVLLSDTVSDVDLLTVQALHAASLPNLTAWVFTVTDLGGTETILMVGLLATLAFAALRQWRSAVAVALSVAVTQALVAALKHVVERSRPPAEDALTHAAGFSFPSGHSAAAMGLYALVAWLAAHHVRGAARVAVLIGAAILIVGIGFSRVYLGAHYPTDVLAGYLVGAGLAVCSWVVACALWPLVPRGARPAVA